MRNKIIRSSVVATTLALVLNSQVASAIVITESQDALGTG